MSQEDVVQTNDLSYIDATVASAVMTINKQKGYGTWTRTGVGTFNWALPAGQAQQLDELMFTLFTKENVGQRTLVFTGGSDTSFDFAIKDNADANVDPGQFAILISVIQ